MTTIDYHNGAISFSTPNDFAFYGKPFESLAAASDRAATHFTVTSGGLEYHYTGTGFSFAGSGAHTPTGGNITGVTVVFAGQALASYSGLGMSIAEAKHLADSAAPFHAFDISAYQNLLHKNLDGDDVIKGSSKADYIEGFFGSDKLSGNGGKDVLLGGSGNDTMDGNSGNDTLVGSGGNDHFRFSSALVASNADVISDFYAPTDTIDLSHTIFHGIGNAGTVLSTAAFHAIHSGGALDSSDRIVYNKDTGDLFYDADGSGAAAAIKFAHLDSLPALSHSDFYVV